MGSLSALAARRHTLTLAHSHTAKFYCCEMRNIFIPLIIHLVFALRSETSADLRMLERERESALRQSERSSSGPKKQLINMNSRAKSCVRVILEGSSSGSFEAFLCLLPRTCSAIKRCPLCGNLGQRLFSDRLSRRHHSLPPPLFHNYFFILPALTPPPTRKEGRNLFPSPPPRQWHFSLVLFLPPFHLKILQTKYVLLCERN